MKGTFFATNDTKNRAIMRVKTPISLLLIALVTIEACHPTSQSSTPTPPSVEVASVVIDTIATRYGAIGYIDAIRTIAITPRTSGYLLRIGYAAGEPVERGVELFVLDSRLAATSLAAAEASLSSARSHLAESRSNYERALPLASIEAISQQQMESYEAEYRAAEAAVASAIEQVASNRIEVEYATIVAPASGIISRSSAEVGDFVGEGTSLTQLATIAVTDTMSVVVSLPLKLYMQHSVARHATYDNEGLLHDIRLTLSDGSVYGAKGVYGYTKQNITPRSGALDIVIYFPNPDNELKMGEFARIDMQLGDAIPRMVIPREAVEQLQGVDNVWVVGNDSRVERRRVDVGGEHGSRYIILDGVKPGERVVVAGGDALHNGDSVTIKR